MDDEEKAWKVSREDTKTLLKDMKYILSNTKRVEKDIEKIVRDMNTVEAAIQPKYKAA